MKSAISINRKQLINLRIAPALIFSLFFLFFNLTCHSTLNAIVQKFTPRISVEEKYDDNIDLVSDIDPNASKTKSWITSVSPGFLMEIESPGSRVALDYEAGFSFYHEDSTPNQSRDSTTHQGRCSWTKQWSPYIQFELNDTFTHSEDTILESDDEIEEIEILRERRIYNRNRGQASISWRLDAKNSMNLSYHNIYFDNESKNYEDSINHGYALNFQRWFNNQFDMVLSSRLNRGKFERPEDNLASSSKDFNDYEGGLILNYHLNPSKHFYAIYTLLAKDFDDRFQVDYWLHQGTLGLNSALSAMSQFGIDGGYFFLDSLDDRKMEGAIYNASLRIRKKKATFNFMAGGGYDQDYTSAENLGSSKFNQARGSADYQLGKNFQLFALTNYRWEKFFGEDNESDRRDKEWLIRIGISYSFSRWLKCDLEGTHTKRESKERDSADPFTEFEDNRILFRITGFYPLIFK